MEYTKDWKLKVKGGILLVVSKDEEIAVVLIGKDFKQHEAKPKLYEALKAITFRLKLRSEGSFELPTDTPAIKQAEQALAEAEGK